MYTEEGRSHFTVRDNVLGHSQQGGIPSSFDRNMATKLAAKTVTWLCDQLDHFASRDGIDRLFSSEMSSRNTNVVCLLVCLFIQFKLLVVSQLSFRSM